MPDFKIDPDYKEVSERVRDLYAKHPDAVLTGGFEIKGIGDKTYVIYRAECIRAPGEEPCVGFAQEEIPGRTPYTKGSEIQNAETSAWGRAIVAAGASESKRIASADEIRSARARETAPDEPARPAPAAPERVAALAAAVKDHGLADWVKDQGFPWPWSDAHCDTIAAKVADAEFVKVGDGDSATSPSRVGGVEGQQADNGDASPDGVASFMPASSVAASTPPESSPQGAVKPRYATQTTAQVDLPPCDQDAAETPTGVPAASNGSGVMSIAQIVAEVRGMPVESVRRSLNAAGKPIDGSTSELRKRLIAFRTSEEPF